MTTLYLFGDETGTMPVDDCDGAFLTAVLATRQLPPASATWGRKRDRFIARLAEWRMVPQVVFLKPFPGYGEQLQRKVGKLSKAGKVRLAHDGANRNFIDTDGVRAANHIWMYCMHQALVRALSDAAFEDRIDLIRIHLDQKSLSPAQCNVFRAVSYKFTTRLRESLSLFPTHPATQRALRAIAKCSDEPEFTWRNEVVEPEFASGLMMAHFLGTHTMKSLNESSATDNIPWLESAGYKRSVMNVAPSLLNSISRESLGRWSEATGLPVSEIDGQ